MRTVCGSLERDNKGVPVKRKDRLGETGIGMASHLGLLLLLAAHLDLACQLGGLDLRHDGAVEVVVGRDDARAEADDHPHHALERHAPAVHARWQALAQLAEVQHALPGEDERHVGAEAEQGIELLGLIYGDNLTAKHQTHAEQSRCSANSAKEGRGKERKLGLSPS